MLYNVVLASAVQQSESAMCICLSPLLGISFPFRSPQSTTWGSLRYTACAHLHPSLCDPMPAPLSMGFSRLEYWRGLTFPTAGDLPDQGMEPVSLALEADSLPTAPPRKPVFYSGSIYFYL